MGRFCMGQSRQGTAAAGNVSKRKAVAHLVRMGDCLAIKLLGNAKGAGSGGAACCLQILRHPVGGDSNLGALGAQIWP